MIRLFGWEIELNELVYKEDRYWGFSDFWHDGYYYGFGFWLFEVSWHNNIR